MLRPETIRTLEDNIGSKLFDTGLSCIFLDLSPQARATKAKINKLDYIKLKSFLHSKGIHKQDEKTTLRMGENICK